MKIWFLPEDTDPFENKVRDQSIEAQARHICDMWHVAMKYSDTHNYRKKWPTNVIEYLSNVPLPEQLQILQAVKKYNANVYGGIWVYKIDQDIKEVKTAISRTKTPEYQADINDINNPPNRISLDPYGKKTIANPYYTYNNGRFLGYAGAPAKFPFTPIMQKQYYSFRNKFADLGVPGFTVAYGNAKDFVLVGYNGKFIWAKNSSLGAGGYNNVYIDGIKHNTSSIVDKTSSDFRKWLP